MQIVTNDGTAPADNVGLCQKCIERYQGRDKEFCQICYRWYGDHENTIVRHPLDAETTIDALTHAEAVGEEDDDRMVRNIYLLFLSPR
jgi:hypothetical protein